MRDYLAIRVGVRHVTINLRVASADGEAPVDSLQTGSCRPFRKKLLRAGFKSCSGDCLAEATSRIRMDMEAELIQDHTHASGQPGKKPFHLGLPYFKRESRILDIRHSSTSPAES